MQRVVGMSCAAREEHRFCGRRAGAPVEHLPRHGQRGLRPVNFRIRRAAPRFDFLHRMVTDDWLSCSDSAANKETAMTTLLQLTPRPGSGRCGEPARRPIPPPGARKSRAPRDGCATTHAAAAGRDKFTDAVSAERARRCRRAGMPLYGFGVPAAREAPNLIGIIDVQFVYAEGLAISEAAQQAGSAQARSVIVRLTREAPVAAVAA